MFDDMWTGAAAGAVGAAIVLTIMVFARKAPKCESCGAEQPKFRKPANMNQVMWGGYTCAGCGKELDGRGRVRKPKI